MQDDDILTDDDRTETRPTTEGSSERTTAAGDAVVEVPEAPARTTAAGGADVASEGREALLDRDRAEGFRRRWEDVQTGFVDRPRDSVEQADRLVLEVMQQVQASFTLARERLESRWSKNDEASTEDLRQALRRYRSFFDRLLGA
jgi:hypothetical protein